MRKLCDKECGLCELDECVQKIPPFDWMKTEMHRTEKSKEQRKKYLKKKRELCIAFGVCRECMAKDATIGLKCIDCHIKENKRNRRKSDGEIPRSERTSYGLCYFCGKKAISGRKTCETHYKEMASHFAKVNHSDNDNHVWRSNNKLVFKKS